MIPRHHLISDAVSSGIVARGTPAFLFRRPPAPARPGSVRRLLQVLREQVSGERLSALTRFWDRSSGRAPTQTELPIRPAETARRVVPWRPCPRRDTARDSGPIARTRGRTSDNCLRIRTFGPSKASTTALLGKMTTSLVLPRTFGPEEPGAGLVGFWRQYAATSRDVDGSASFATHLGTNARSVGCPHLRHQGHAVREGRSSREPRPGVMRMVRWCRFHFRNVDAAHGRQRSRMAGLSPSTLAAAPPALI